MYIKHSRQGQHSTLDSRQCFITFPNTSNFIKNTPLHVVFSTFFSVLRNMMKHCSNLSCLIYYIRNYIFTRCHWPADVRNTTCRPIITWCASNICSYDHFVLKRTDILVKINSSRNVSLSQPLTLHISMEGESGCV